MTYVRFAVTRRPHFEVMFRTDLYHADAPEVVAARARAAEALYVAVSDTAGRASCPHRPVPVAAWSDRGGRRRTSGWRALAAWSIAHGFATLWLSGAFPDREQDPTETARTIFG